MVEYVDHLHEHFVDPVRTRERALPAARPRPATAPRMKPESIAEFSLPGRPGMAVTVGAARLGLGTLRRLPAQSRPLIRPGAVPAGIVHLGLGAFHRAHQAVYTEEAMAPAGGDWGIVGVAPRSTDAGRGAAPRRTACSASPRSPATGAQTRVVGALAGVRHAASDPARGGRRCWPTRRSGWSRSP